MSKEIQKSDQSTDVTEEIITYKGFDKDFKCRGFQFEIGKTYEHEGVIEACKSGFHACEHPLNVFNYYPPSSSRFAIVKQSGEIIRHEDDTKVASARITITAELTLSELINSAIKWVFDRAKWIDGNAATEDNEAATASGYQGAATASGDRGAATASGDQGAATASGYQGAATVSGYQGAATASGTQGAATVSGYQGAATVSGNEGTAIASGVHSVSAALGFECKAKASHSGAIVLCCRGNDGEILHIRASKVGDNGIKPDTFYILDESGEFIEVAD